jgi:hypothetical protein
LISASRPTGIGRQGDTRRTAPAPFCGSLRSWSQPCAGRAQSAGYLHRAQADKCGSGFAGLLRGLGITPGTGVPRSSSRGSSCRCAAASHKATEPGTPGSVVHLHVPGSSRSASRGGFAGIQLWVTAPGRRGERPAVSGFARPPSAGADELVDQEDSPAIPTLRMLSSLECATEIACAS